MGFSLFFFVHVGGKVELFLLGFLVLDADDFVAGATYAVLRGGALGGFVESAVVWFSARQRLKTAVEIFGFWFERQERSKTKKRYAE